MRWIYFLAILPLYTTAQQVEILSGDTPEFKKGYQFSSIVIHKNKIILPSEKCNEIVVLDMDGKHPASKKMSVSNAQIEGAALYGDTLLLLSETSGNQKVYVYHLKKGKVVDSIPLNGFDYTDENKGVEGIAVDSIGNSCYILQEKDDDGYSRIYQYKLFNDGKMAFTPQNKTVILQHSFQDKQPFSRRYTDLFYSNDTLYMLGSYYNKADKHSSQYFIDILTKDGGEPYFSNAATVNTEDHVFLDLSRMMRRFQKRGKGPQSFSTNLEGITIYNNKIYLVSDNVMGEATCTTHRGAKTLLIRLAKPY